MSKITNDGLTRSGRECFMAVPIWQEYSGCQRVNRFGQYQYNGQQEYRHSHGTGHSWTKSP